MKNGLHEARFVLSVLKGKSIGFCGEKERLACVDGSVGGAGGALKVL